MRSLLKHIFILLISTSVAFHVQSQNTDTLPGEILVYKFTIEQDIFPPALRIFNRAMDEAEALNADVLLLELDTYGGAVDVMDDMRTRLMNYPNLTIVFIRNNAASAGALIAISCDSIYMRAEATIGAATVVDGTGTEAPDKYQSYFRSKFRSTAEQKGRDPDIAEAMVDASVYIPGIIDSGKVLTFTASEAVRHGFAEGIVTSYLEALEKAGIADYQLVEYTPTWVDRVIGFFTHPAVSSLLILVIMGGIYFELQTPGIGFPLIAAVIAAVLFFTPYYLDGLASHWEIAIFVIGLALLAVEIFVLTGFGIAGILGLLFIITGLTLSMIPFMDGFDFTFTPPADVARSLLVVVGSILATIILAIVFAGRFQNSPLTRSIVFHDSQQSSEGYSVDYFRGNELLHKTGIAVTDLRPAGKVEIDDDRYEAQSAGEWISKGDEVVVLRAKGTTLIVKKA